ncbi:hypothetical protein HanIR_Chr15g0732431 [Helianthus annuus]|nr:hypothetical protein HanIR_Chr15g0732431 [Helianthus annuus]
MKDQKYASDIDSITKAQVLIKPYVNATHVISPSTLNSIDVRKLCFSSVDASKRD